MVRHIISYALPCNHMSDRSSVIIAGMHRSHTSLVAHAFHNAGLFLGDDLIGAASSNPYGHFESQAIVDFHKQQITDHGLSSKSTFINRAGANALSRSETFQSEAATVLENHFLCTEERKVIGWKDPRTPFFLEGWHHVLTDPYFIFVVRHPVQVVRSLNYRTRQNARRSFFPFLSTRHFNLWDETNLCILDFVERHPQRCIVIHAPDDLQDKAKIKRINDVIAQKWRIDLAPISFTEVMDPSLLRKKTAPSRLENQYLRRPLTMAIYDRMITLSKQ